MLLLKVSVSSLYLHNHKYFANCGFGAMHKNKTMITNWKNWTIGFQSSTLKVIPDFYTLHKESEMWNTLLCLYLLLTTILNRKWNTIEIWQMKNQLVDCQKIFCITFLSWEYRLLLIITIILLFTCFKSH